MEQRTPNQKNVKVCPFVPVTVRAAAEKRAGKAMRHVPGPVKATRFLAEWLVGGHDIATAKTPADALAAAEKLYGKPLLPPAGGAT